MWSLLGRRGVEVLAWESFGQDWAVDVTAQLKLDCKVKSADYGLLPDLSQIDFNSDVIFAWNGTTSGVRVPDGNFIPSDRAGLTICDATSAVFAVDLPWDKLDATTFSWQKALGGEAAHGMLILSPRAVERIESYSPPWPIPKLFRLNSRGKLNEGIFDGATINTPSMLCVEDCILALNWARDIGGLSGMMERADRNAAAIDAFVNSVDWLKHLAQVPNTRSNTSVCLAFYNSKIPIGREAELAKSVVGRLAAEGVGLDIGSYRSAPPGLRIWSGPTVETSDLQTLFPWVEWAFNTELVALTVTTN